MLFFFFLKLNFFCHARNAEKDVNTLVKHIHLADDYIKKNKGKAVQRNEKHIMCEPLSLEKL